MNDISLTFPHGDSQEKMLTDNDTAFTSERLDVSFVASGDKLMA